MAEVLVTLTILGILASIIVPNVIQQYKKTQTISRLKIAYSMFYEATRQAEIVSGIDSDKWDYNTLNDVMNYFVPSLKIAHDCRDDQSRVCIGTPAKDLVGKKLTNANGGSSFTLTEESPGYTYIKHSKDTYKNFFWLNRQSMILSNGMSVGFFVNEYYDYVQMFIDIDGPNKGPNQQNVDIFSLYFTNSKPTTKDKNPRFNMYTVEWSISQMDYNRAKWDCTGSGWSSTGDCFAYIMFSGWKIPKDYPVKF